MFGWFTLAAARASRHRRCRAVSSLARRRQRLEGDRALEPIVPRRVDDAHAAFAQLAVDRIAADTRQAFAVRARDSGRAARRRTSAKRAESRPETYGSRDQPVNADHTSGQRPGRIRPTCSGPRCCPPRERSISYLIARRCPRAAGDLVHPRDHVARDLVAVGLVHQLVPRTLVEAVRDARQPGARVRLRAAARLPSPPHRRDRACLR